MVEIAAAWPVPQKDLYMPSRDLASTQCIPWDKYSTSPRFTHTHVRGDFGGVQKVRTGKTGDRILTSLSSS